MRILIPLVGISLLITGTYSFMVADEFALIAFSAATLMFILLIMVRRITKKLDTPFDNSTRMVESKSGMKVQIYNDWPDEMADVLTDCLKGDGVVSGKIEGGKVIRD